MINIPVTSFHKRSSLLSSKDADRLIKGGNLMSQVKKKFRKSIVSTSLISIHNFFECVIQS